MPLGQWTNSISNGVSCGAARACVSAGSYTDATDEQTALAEGWTGQAWSRQPTPGSERDTGSILNGISCPSADACMAVGTVTQTWDGAAWTPRPVPGLGGFPGGNLAGVSCPAAGACTAVGSNYRSGHQVPLAEGWDGKAWKIQATPVPQGSAGAYLTAVSCTAASSCVAVGNFIRNAGPELTLAESWNGKTWRIARTPNPRGPNDSFLNGVSCTSASACVAVGINGSFNDRRGGAAHPFVPLSEVRNGTVWTIKQVPVPAHATLTYLQAVSCGAVSSCTAVGSSVESPTEEHTLAAVWNGRAWRLQATPNPNVTGSNVLDGVSCRGAGRCTAVGWYDAPVGQATFAEGEGGL